MPKKMLMDLVNLLLIDFYFESRSRETLSPLSAYC